MKSFVHDLIPVKRCEYDDRGFFCITLTYLARHIDAVHLRHLPVEKDKIIRFMLCMAYFEHVECFTAAVTCISLYTCLIQNDACMLSCYLLIIDHEDPHILRINIICRNELMLAVIQRNDNRKRRTDAFLRFNGDRTVHEFDDILCDRHTESCAAVFVITAAVLLRESIEYPRNEFFFHSDTGILYGELER